MVVDGLPTLSGGFCVVSFCVQVRNSQRVVGECEGGGGGEAT